MHNPNEDQGISELRSEMAQAEETDFEPAEDAYIDKMEEYLNSLGEMSNTEAWGAILIVTIIFLAVCFYWWRIWRISRKNREKLE